MKQASAANTVTEQDTTHLAAFAERPTRDMVSIALARALAEVVQQRRVSPDALFGDDVDLLYTEPAERWLSRARFQQLFARAVQLTGEPALGLYCGLQPSPASFGVMSPLIGNSPTLRRAIELMKQFQSLLVSGLRVELTERLGVAQLRCDLGGQNAGDRGLMEIILAGLTRALQSFGCGRDEILAIRIPYSRPTYYHAYSLIFGGAERFAQDCVGVDFAAVALERRHLHRHAELHTLVLAQAERTLKQLWQPLSFTQRVRALMNERSASQLPDMLAAAHDLGLSVRSLRRHLEEEGTSFRELTQSLLRESACSMLRNPAIPLQSIAHQLGFSDVTAFHRAFRRWAGLTAAEYRSAFLGSPEVAGCSQA
jgi:AraC-like DNA-binding protein